MRGKSIGKKGREREEKRERERSKKRVLLFFLSLSGTKEENRCMTRDHFGSELSLFLSLSFSLPGEREKKNERMERARVDFSREFIIIKHD